jgi:murein DD-endopeptidase MepM/ murein hydrolase activator NlpD
MLRLFLLGLLLCAAACTPGSTTVVMVQTATQTSVPSLALVSATAALSPTFTAQPTASPVRENSPTAPPPTATTSPGLSLCSPLEGITIPELGKPDLLKNPFQPPRPGNDDGHHGVDFAFWSRGDRKTMLGLPIQSILSGKVAGVIHNRQPYGNAVIIETTLDAFSAAQITHLELPTPAPTVQPASSLYCPGNQKQVPLSSEQALYVLYAHMNKTPLVEPGQHVQCGQPIGEVGTTGKSVNLHLHLETRLGPAGMAFPVMAHYENDATPEEMQNYCTWRVSGLFQMFDPMILFNNPSLQP